MAKDLDPCNKGNPTKKVRSGNMVAKEPRSVSLGFSLKPESRISSAAVEVVKHNPEVAAKEKGRVDPGQGCGKEGGFSRKTATTPEAMGIFFILLSKIPRKYIVGLLTCYTGKIQRRLWINCRNSKGQIITIPKKLLLKINCAPQRQGLWPKL
jgi:hypothetical protein